MVRGNLKILETGRVIEGKLIPDKKQKDMPVNNSGSDIIDGWYDTEEDVWVHESKEKKTMKNIFLDVKNIKKQKFSEEIAKKIKFAEIGPLMDMKEAQEGYLGAYSESEFFAWRVQQIHKFYPDLIRVTYLKSEKFLVDLFKYCKVPPTAYYKAFEELLCHNKALTVKLVVFS